MPVSFPAIPAMVSASSPALRPLVTGATGFVGSRLAARLQGCAVLSMAGGAWYEHAAATDFRGATVIHLAARVHDPEAESAAFERDNVEKTRALAEMAAAGGAVRLVLASSVKVFGEESAAKPFGERDAAAPADAYAQSKWRAEQALHQIAARTGLEAVVVRMPLVYGAGAAGNFRALVGLADSPWWLPFDGIANRRSLVHVDDVVEALIVAGSHAHAPGRTLLAAHPDPVSTPQLVAAIRAALGRPRRLFRMPPPVLEAGASLLGQGARMRRLTRSLQVDPAGFMRDLDWRPRVQLEAGLAAMLGRSRA